MIDIEKKFTPKPNFNLKWYKNNSPESSSAIEEKILKIIMDHEPEEYTNAIRDNFCWPIFFHLSSIRENILNWYPFEKEANILEIGCGMGAITRILCDSCTNVVSIEPCLRRATATLWRCRDKENLEIIVGNFNDIQFDRKFDYITLIGDLNDYKDSPFLQSTEEDFLIKIRELLNPNGKLLLTVENQFGLKYWCGVRESRTQIPFGGLNHFMLSSSDSKAFSKAALEKLIKRSGFQNIYFYYPMPDYKFPTVIYSQDYLPKNENMLNMSCYYDPDDKALLIQEKMLYKDIIDNNVFEFFANSFLLECTNGNSGTVTFACINITRHPEYQTVTRFLKNRKIEKFALNRMKGKKHIRQLIKNQNALQKRGLNIWEYQLLDGKLLAEYTNAALLEDVFAEKCRNKEISQAYAILDQLYNEILKSSDLAPWEDNIIYQIDTNIKPDKRKYGPILKVGYVDMIMRNAFFINEKNYWFDQEWVLENVPAKYILFRALLEFYISFQDINKIIPFQDIIEKYEIKEVWKDFCMLNNLLMKSILDWIHIEELKKFQGFDINICIQNIVKLLS